MFLSLMLALKRLGRAASAKAEESRESVITARHIEQVFAVSIVCVHHSTYAPPPLYSVCVYVYTILSMH